MSARGVKNAVEKRVPGDWNNEEDIIACWDNGDVVRNVLERLSTVADEPEWYSLPRIENIENYQSPKTRLLYSILKPVAKNGDSLSHTTLNRRFVKEPEKLRQHQVKAVVRFLFKEDLWLKSKSKDGGPDAVNKSTLYGKFAEHFGISDISTEKTTKNAEGVFRIFKKSIMYPGMIVVGMAQIKKDEDGSLRVLEFYKTGEQVDSDRKFRHSQVTEAFKGFLWRKGPQYTMIFDPVLDSSIHHALLTDVNYGYDGAISSMAGFRYGVEGRKIYTTPIYYDRVFPSFPDASELLTGFGFGVKSSGANVSKNEEEVILGLEKELDIYPPEQISELILRKLSDTCLVES